MASKKAAVPKKAPFMAKPKSHPTYTEMIKEAIMALKERSGSSQYAIAKHMQDNQKDLPANFKKLLLVQLKKLVAAGKLTKVKNSFKLGAVEKPAAVKKAPTVKKAADQKAKSSAQVKAKPKTKVKTPVKVKKVMWSDLL